jgi:protein-S-isoprenylcysteine O-methyltransferase Ste14
MNVSRLLKQSDRQPDVAAGVRRWWIQGIFGVLILAATLFIPAGRLDWAMGWALVVITAIWVIATGLVSGPELLAERAERRKGTKTWDMVVLGVAGLGAVARPIVAGLDVRYGWTAHMPLTLQIVALAVAVLGYALTVWAMAANAFFSKVVRIQDDRGHIVATGGPYQFVRHPGYVGEILFELTTPIMLGSWWALIPGGFAALFFVVRTALEDKTLHEELPGYAEYARRTRYRLLPGIW